MEIFVLILLRSLSIWLSAVSFAMIARMLLTFFTNPEESKLYRIAYAISEPAIVPVRAVMAKMGVGQNSPLDIPFTVTYLIIFIIRLFLP